MDINESYEQPKNSFINDIGKSPYMKEILDSISTKSNKKSIRKNK